LFWQEYLSPPLLSGKDLNNYNPMATFTTKSAEETQLLALKLSQKYQNGAILALIGNLGSGKTTFTQGFGKGLGIKDKILSPTFILMRQYSLPENLKAKLFHLDLYRLEDIKEIGSLGLDEIFSNPRNIVLIEWAEKLGSFLPKNIILIQFKHIKDNIRQIEIS